MRKYLLLLAALVALLGFGPAPVSAAPTLGANIGEQVRNSGLVQEARWFCYSRVTGRFLHWGRCGGRRWYRPRRRIYRRYYYYRPRYHYYRRYW
jgi:hypothetical protein